MAPSRFLEGGSAGWSTCDHHTVVASDDAGGWALRSDAATVDEYMAELPDDRREAIAALRDLIVENLPPGYEESMLWGMITYAVPLERYPDTYNGQPLSYVSLANQKRHMALYLMGVYSDDAEAADFRRRWEAAGHKLDMGKSCVRFKRLEDVPLDVVADAVASTPVDAFIERYDAHRAARSGS
jgi:Domain of unknown function (DU1801)